MYCAMQILNKNIKLYTGIINSAVIPGAYTSFLFFFYVYANNFAQIRTQKYFKNANVFKYITKNCNGKLTYEYIKIVTSLVFKFVM